MSYIHLHNHFDYSLLDGMGKVDEYIQKAKELGMTALAMTDHGTMAGVVEFHDKCKKAGIKPIIGCEFYEAPESRFYKELREGKPYYHLILLAKNEEGYKNLCRLTTRANKEGFYYKPRIDTELLEKHHEGLICLSGCLGGRIPQYVLNGNYDKAEEWIERYKNIFGDDFYLEIQNHGILDEQTVFNLLPILAGKHGVKVVATNDCHYVNKEDAEAHEWLLAMQTKKTIDDPTRIRYTGDYSLRPEEEMRKLFPNNQQVFDNTNEIADKCEFAFPEKPQYRMPKVVIPKEWGDNYYGYMESEAWKGLNKRYPVGHEEREQAIKDLAYELSVVKQMGFAEYFLDTQKTILWCKENGVLVGPARGSGAGSRLNYCLGITDIDPIKYGLLFERFLNPERVSMPDIDVDYERRFQRAVIESEKASNGADKVARIQTFGTMLAKGIVKDCFRTAGFEYAIGDKISKLIGNELGITLDKAWNTNVELRDFINDNPEYKKVWEIALRLEGTKKSQGMHACGIIPTPIPCEELFPCRVDEETGDLVCLYNMVEIERLGNLKKDILMLRNLSIINVANEAIKKRYNTDIPLWTEEILNDKDALKLMSEGKTDGIFQFESAGMKGFMKKLKPDCFEDIIAGVALYRPGPMDSIDDYIHNKHHPEDIKYATPLLKPILENTYGIIVYQEQVMQIVQALAGFSKAEADVVRKAMGKKKQELMEEEGRKFVYGDDKFPGCIKNGIPENVALALWKQMESFGKYAFNKSHAAAYAAITLQTAYLKEHYPLEFYAGLLSSVMDNTEKLVPYLSECGKDKVKVIPPDINTSISDFSVTDDDKLTYGLVAVKGAGEDTIKDIIHEREANGRYQSLYDFVKRNQSINRKTVEGLIKAGAFDFTGYNRPTLIENLEIIQSSLKKEAKIDSNQLSIFDLFSDLGDFNPEPDIKPVADWSTVDKAMYEKEATGLFVSVHPLSDNPYNIRYTEISDINGVPDENGVAFPNDFGGTEIVIHSIVSELKHHQTKNGDMMAFMKVEDENDNIDVIIFPKVFKELKQKGKEFKKNDIVTIKGKVSLDKDEPSIFANNIYHENELSTIYQKHVMKSLSYSR